MLETSVSLVYLPQRLPWVDLPADMTGETDRDEVVEESEM